MAEQMDECLKELRVLVILVGAVGRPVSSWCIGRLGTTVSASTKTTFLAELQAVGADSWQQVLDDAEREPLLPEEPDRRLREHDQ
jgi:hypothetical protein